MTAPIAKRVPSERVHHGHTFVDEYEWLRDKENPEVVAHLEAENAWTEKQTAHLAPLREKIFDDLWIQPAAGDAGGALGAAIFLHYQLLEQPRLPVPEDAMQGSLLGPRFTNDGIRAVLDAAKAPYHFIADEAVLLDTVAGLLAESTTSET